MSPLPDYFDLDKYAISPADRLMRIYEPDVEKLKTWSPPKAERVR